MTVNWQHYKAKYKWIAFLVFLTAVLSFPVISGYLNSSPGKKFLGVPGLYVDDTYYYLALGPAQAVKGKILFKDLLGRVGDEDIFINPIGNMIGLISLVTGASVSASFNIFRIITSLFLVLCFAFLARQFISNAFTRAVAILVFAFGAGFDFIFRLLHISVIDSVDDSIPEANMFIAMSGEYYIPLANALFILALVFAYQTFFKKQPKVIHTGITLLALGAVYVYGMIAASIIVAVIVLYNAWLKNEAVESFRKGGLIALFCIPIVAYYLWLIYKIPEDNLNDDWIIFPFLGYAFSFGFIFLFAVIRIITHLKYLNSSGEVFLSLWMISTFILVSIPIEILPFQLQMIIGAGAPLSILGCLAIEDTWVRIKNRISRKSASNALKYIALGIFLIVISSTNIRFYIQQFIDLKKTSFPHYIDTDVSEAIDWCKKYIHEDKQVLVSRHMAKLFTGFSGCSVYYGIAPNEVITPQQKFIDNVFAEIETGDAGKMRSAFKAQNISYIFLDKTLIPGNYEDAIEFLNKNFKVLFKNNSAVIYEV